MKDEGISIIFGYRSFVLRPRAFRMIGGVGDLCFLNDQLNECVLILKRLKKRRDCCAR